jgi:glycosyltransferase involved in cell wall biosynthesis
MNWRSSRFGKVWSSISKNGLRAGVQDGLARWARSRLQIPQDVLRDYGWVMNPDCPATLQPPPFGPLRINWLVPPINKSSGGLFNIFRAIQFLELRGHEQNIYVVGDPTFNAEEARTIVNKFYFPNQALIQPFRGSVADSDALVATSWQTAYTARALGNTARKFYFVQDLEHLFSPEGSVSEFAKQTYQWGFYGLTGGQWIADVLRKEYGMESSAFGFSFDRKLYSPNGPFRFPEKKNRVLFYARATTLRRGFELGILALSLVAKKMPDTEFVLVGFPPRSVELPFSALFPGTLPVSELGALYRSCNIALVLSHTNLSLLPLELMACGCAVVSNSGPNVEWLLKDTFATLARPTPEHLAHAIIELLSNEQLRLKKAAAGAAFAEQTHWETEITTIERGMYKGLGILAMDECNV